LTPPAFCHQVDSFSLCLCTCSNGLSTCSLSCTPAINSVTLDSNLKALATDVVIAGPKLSYFQVFTLETCCLRGCDLFALIGSVVGK
ncbi:hypothetical protein C8Q80DRAFT_1204582, partial [Daedaleopsis nitida]